jgi:hypothetical protein
MKIQRHIFLFRGILVTVLVLTWACSKPAKIELSDENIVLDGIGTKKKITARVLDDKGRLMTEGVTLTYLSEDKNIIRYDQDGTVEAVASGEAEVEIEVVNTPLKATVQVRVKNPASVKVSHEKLRLWTGQVKEIWAEVRSEKDAFIEGYLPEWSSEDPSTVLIETISDPKRRQSWVRITGLKSGITHINAAFKHLTKQIRVSVFDENEEASLDGTIIPKEDAR